MPQTQTQIKNLLRDKNIRLRKSLGQNLLIDSNILRLITSTCDLSRNDIVIEIGPGTGALTEHLAKQGGHIIAVEQDEKIMQIGKEHLSDYSNIEWIHQDVLKLDLQKLILNYPNQKFKVVGNLPYYITTPILMRFLEEKFSFERIVITIQKEVAERIIAKPGSKDYGVLSLMVQFRCQAKLIKKISKTCFFPVPDVDSSILQLLPHTQPPVSVKDEELFFTLIRGAFNQRRKTLLNALDAIADKTQLDKECLNELLKRINLSPGIRGERLSMEDFANLSNELIHYQELQ